MSVTILGRREVPYCEELRQMVDLDGTHTEESKSEQIILCKEQLQLPETTASMLDIKKKNKMPKLISKQPKLVA